MPTALCCSTTAAASGRRQGYAGRLQLRSSPAWALLCPRARTRPAATPTGEGARADANGVAWRTIDPQGGKVLLDREAYVVLDVRTAREYDEAHITKPPLSCIGVPFPSAQFAEKATAQLKRSARKGGVLIMTAEGGAEAEAAAEAICACAFANVVVVEGGWIAWRRLYTTTGRDTPPAGRWVSTGKEALKSGLNVGDAATKYEELLNVEELAKKGFK